MKVIVVGNGFIANHLNHQVVEDRLLPDAAQIKNQIIDKYKPDVVINCVAYCGVRNIDDCESNKLRTVESNVTIPCLLATECIRHDIRMVHIGSGCIFMGRSPNEIIDHSTAFTGWGHYDRFIDTGWTEKDIANPESFYSRTKYAVDLVLGNSRHIVIPRIRMPISWKNQPRNLLNKLIKYDKVVETPNSVTFIDDLVRAIDWFITNDKSGIYHVANPTPLLHSQILEAYRKYKPTHRYTKITAKELENLVTAARSNCILNTDKLAQEGFEMTPSLPALEQCMERYISNL